MDPIKRRLRTVLHHPATIPVVLLLLAVVSVDLDRFPRWDEAVFLNQASGRDGAPAPESHLGPTREIGSAWKLHLLTALTSSYPNLRLLHIALGVLVLALAAISLARVTRLPTAIVGLVLGTWWLTFSYLGQFFRFTLLTFVLLATVAQYSLLRQADEPPPTRAAMIGGLFVVGLALGPFETGIVLVCTGLHWLVTGRVHRAARPFLAFVATVGAGGLLLFLLDTVPRYGSLGGRVEALGDLEGPTSTSTFGWSLLDDYVRVMFREPVSNARWTPEGGLATAGFLVAGLLLLAGVIAIGRWVIGLGRRDADHFTALCSISFIVLMAFLAGFYSHMTDQYFILPGSLLLVLGLALARDAVDWSLARPTGLTTSTRRDLRLVIASVGLLAFVIPNIATAQGLDRNWSEDGTHSAVLALVRDGAGGRPCAGFALYNIPAVQWSTGCETSRARSIDQAMTRAGELDDDLDEGLVRFIYWPVRAVDQQARERLADRGWSPLVDEVGDGVPDFQAWVRD